MAFENLLQLANDLEWLGCELESVGHRHALEGYPHAGLAWQEFRDKQKGVLRTCDKLEHELEGTVRFDAEKLVGVAFPLDDALNVVAGLLEAVEQVKFLAVYQVHELPEAVRSFNRLLRDEFGEVPRPAAMQG